MHKTAYNSEAYKLGKVVSNNFAKDVLSYLKEVNQNQFNALFLWLIILN
jgi:hypothetical protein